MKLRRVLLPMLLGIVTLTSTAQEIDYASTIEVLPTDSHETIIAKAAHVVPTPVQLSALQNEFIAFIHIGPNTFTRSEWGSGMEDPKVFDLKTLDTDQWVRAMKDAGMKMVVLTTKHHDGFVLWQSRYTDHGIMSTDFKEGKGDIMKELSESCRKYGMKLGVYLSPADLYQIEHPDGLYGNLSPKTTRTIPRQVEGRPFENETTFTFDSIDDYNEYFLNQLFELLTEYGPIHEVWFDGAHPKSKGGQTYNYMAWRKLIRTLAPEAVIFGREDVRWGGNEAGNTRETEWNVIPYMDDPRLMSRFRDNTAQDLGSREKLYGAKFLHYQQPEMDTSIRQGWFYRDDDRQQVRSADDVFDIYERSVGGNATFILNIPPNREGRFSPTDSTVLAEVGRRINETYGTDLLQGASAPTELLDGDIHTFIMVEGPVEIILPAPRTINRIMLQEAVADRGERVESHAVDAWIDGQWQEIADATNIGYKRILRFPDVTTDRLRIRVTGQRMTPSLANVSAHHYQARPPQLSAVQSADGMVTISPMRHRFDWKSGAVNPAEALAAGNTIHYTTDGSVPTAQSPVYQGPFAMESGIVKAVSVLNGQTGPELDYQASFPKAGWTIIGASSQTEKHPADAALDANASTFWMSEEEALPFIEIDLGKEHSINGFAYTPQTSDSQGMMAKGNIQVSADGKKWRTVESWDFGNLINDPVKRFHYFKAPVKTRYVRIEATEIAADGRLSTAAEFDLF